MEPRVSTETLTESYRQRLDDRSGLWSEKRLLESDGRFNPEHLLDVLGLAEAYRNTLES